MGQALKKEDNVMNSGAAYDDVPYDSSSYRLTHPENMATMATLFGLTPPDLETANVLELGCAGGGNLLPLAMRFPQGRYTGIDLSARQIETANAHKDALGLENINFKAMDIMNVDKNFGTFDYIICHGIYSWVPTPVRDAILRICRDNLSENGVAVVTYNTLPGWAAAKGLRDMMLYHTKDMNDPAEKVQQARELLNFLLECSTESFSNHNFLKHEIGLLKNADDSYLMHDHLEAENTAFYIHEFMEEAQKHGLQYLGDTSISQMYLGNLPQKAQETFAGIQDIVRQEQYMDFVNNRRFRHTMLTGSKAVIKRSVSPDLVKKFYIGSYMKPDGAVANNTESVKFSTIVSNATLSTTDPATKAFLTTIGKYPGYFRKLDDVIRDTAEGYDYVTEEQAVQVAETFLMTLVLKGFCELSISPSSWMTSLSEKPESHKLARYQATLPGAKWVTNMRGEKTDIDMTGALVVQYADGTRTVDEIVQEVARALHKRGAEIRHKGEIVESIDAIAEAIRPNVDTVLDGALRGGVLTA